MQRIAGPGVPMQTPTNLYPSDLFSIPYDLGTNEIMLSPGDALGIPTGDFLVDFGNYCMLQQLDPLTGTYVGWTPARDQSGPYYSNGAQWLRVANLTGCPVGAYVAGGGSGFTQATAALTASAGGSTWRPIIGGSLVVQTIANAGASFTFPGVLMIPDPPAFAANGVGGVAATGYFAIANGTVSSVSLVGVGAGYVSGIITGLCLPSPWDPNYGAITPGTVNFTLGNAGAVTAALCTYNGSSLANLTNLTLTAAGGAGSGATITPLICQTVSATSIVAGGGGWGNVAAPAKVLTVGGGGTAGAISNPYVDFSGFVPRDANITATCNAGGTITGLTVLDSGVFVAAATAAIVPGGTLPSTLASIALTMGGVRDTIRIQPL
jgi:hypothetical protein